MKRNMFGEMQPENFDDLVTLADEKGFDPRQAYVTVSDGSIDNGPDTNFHGWCAEISAEVEDDGEMDTVNFNTCAWPDKDSLLADLKAAKFLKVEDA